MPALKVPNLPTPEGRALGVELARICDGEAERKKHLHRYVNEFAFRLNDGNVARHTTQRLRSFVDATAGKRLTYKALTA